MVDTTVHHSQRVALIWPPSVKFAKVGKYWLRAHWLEDLGDGRTLVQLVDDEGWPTATFEAWEVSDQAGEQPTVKTARCVICHKDFETRRLGSKFCSPKCKQKAQRRK